MENINQIVLTNKNLLMDQLQYLLERLDEMEQKFDGKLTEILIQTTKTNGRVGRVEEWKGSRQKIEGKAIWVLIGAVVALGVFYIQNYISKH